MRNLMQATLYPGIGAIETTNISVGRGTDTPFEQIGAPWIDGAAARRGAERARAFPGCASIRSVSRRRRASTRTRSARASSSSSPIALALRPVRLGVELASPLHKLYGAKYELEAAERLFGSRDGLTRVRRGDDPAAIARAGRPPRRAGGCCALRICFTSINRGASPLGLPDWLARGGPGPRSARQARSLRSLAVCAARFARSRYVRRV